MLGSARSAITLGTRRLLAAKPSPIPAVKLIQPRIQQPFLRPFSVLGTSPWQRVLEVHTPSATPPAAVALTQSGALSAQGPCAEANSLTQASGEPVVDSVRSDGMVFEVGLSFVVMHYQSIFIGVMRCLFQSFRPLLILFVFGQILKAVFFVAGAPIWLSFFSIWLFEVIYGLAQCAISFIFISFFYNNLSFARMRPALSQLFRSQREKFSRVAKTLC